MFGHSQVEREKETKGKKEGVGEGGKEKKIKRKNK